MSSARSSARTSRHRRRSSFDSQTLTEEARSEARAAIPPQYDFTADNAIAIANEGAAAFTERVRRVDTAFATDLTPEERTALLETAIAGLSETAQATLLAIDAPRWAAVRTEAARVLDATLRTELRDTEVAADPGARSGAGWVATSTRPSGCWRPRSSPRSSSRTRRSTRP